MTEDQFPHRNLYTRIKPSTKGVGVFAIRDIPKDTELFVGDIGNIVRVSVADVEKIEDLEVRRMYFDFCPVVDGYFVAPNDFNQITMGWYLNHSDNPNVSVRPEMQFFTSRFVEIGEELTADYTTYSEHAAKYAPAWVKPSETG